MTMTFDLDDAAARIAADPLDRVLFNLLGRERTHEITVQRVNRLHLFASTRKPVTIRQGYYHLDTLGLIAKTEVGYAIVVTLMNEMVEAGIIDPEWIVDLSREPLIWRGYDSVAHALREMVAGYFKNLWLNEPHYVQVWIEKQGLIETIKSPCMRRCVSLWPAKGYASRSFLRRAVKEISVINKPTFVYAFGDYDAAGWFASQHIQDMLNEYARREQFGRRIAFERVALSPEQIDAFDLPTRDSKERDDQGRPIPSAPAFRDLQEATLGRDGAACRPVLRVRRLRSRGPAQPRDKPHRAAMSDERLAKLEAQEADEKAELQRIISRLERKR
jgi:hypothetical protein